MPQNHPSPKDAVLYIGDAFVSIAGIPFTMLMEDSLFSDSWLTAGSRVCEQAQTKHKNPTSKPNQPMVLRSLFFITHILSFDADPIDQPTGFQGISNNKHDLGWLCKDLIKIGRLGDVLD